MIHYGGYMTNTPESELRPATEDEIAAFAAQEAERVAAGAKRELEEQRILDFVGAGLTPSDFCRYRGASVSEDGKTVVVCTRENGIGGFSIDAVRKAGESLVGRTNDDGDSTYAYLTFRVKEETK
jgi:hypothetical protein